MHDLRRDAKWWRDPSMVDQLDELLAKVLSTGRIGCRTL
jgi:hypothetical protein